MAMEDTKILPYFEGKTILITGATGFLAKIFVEKILRLQPNVKKIFLLMRATASKSTEQRLYEEIVGSELFGVIREKHGQDFNSIISSKVVAIKGDVSYENLGIVDEDLRQQMWREVDIIVNSAATTKFDDRYDVSFETNALGTMHVQDFGTKCAKLQMLLHISTAYVSGIQPGLVLEKAFGVGETLVGAKIPILDIISEKNLIEEKLRYLQTRNLSRNEITIAMKELGSERATLHGWPNTYVFTKAMGEMMLESFKEKCNVVIIRPTIITSTFKDPFPGWIEGLRTMDSIFGAYGKGTLKFFLGDPESLIDLIPGDMVVNCMVAAIASHYGDEQNLIVYQIGSSRCNPVKYKEIRLAMIRYLGKHPFLDCKGKPIRVGRLSVFNTTTSFRNYIKFRTLPLLKMLRSINVICCFHFGSSYTNSKRKINHVLRLAVLYEPYLFSKEIYDDDNTENLRNRLKGSNLYFDPKCIMWEDYLFNTHFPGIVKYVLK